MDHAFDANDETVAAWLIAEHARKMVGRGEIAAVSDQL